MALSPVRMSKKDKDGRHGYTMYNVTHDFIFILICYKENKICNKLYSKWSESTHILYNFS